jgi:hypothetical protein
MHGFRADGAMATATQTERQQERRPVPTDPERVPKKKLARARAGRRVIIGMLALFMLIGVSGFLGPKTATATVSRSGYTVVVTYPAVTRPGLPIRWEYTIRHAGGFDGPVSLSTTFDYLHLFDLTNVEPEATSATSSGGEVVYRFAPPAGDELRISMDATAESGFHEMPSTTTRVIVDGSNVVSVTFSTKVVP